MHRSTVLVVLAGVVAGLASPPQDSPRQDPAKPTTPAAARAEDVASVDGIVAALYASISGPVGQARDFDRMRSLFAEGARLLPTHGRGERFAVRPLSVDDYVRGSGEQLQRIGFREVEIARRVEAFGPVVHAWSTYASYRGEEKEPFQRGINSIQLSFDGTRWWVQSVFWVGESKALPIPERYLPGGK